MPRIARVVAPGLPHHITQRGNRRQQTFFCQEDYQAYLDFMAEWCQKCQIEIWAYCLMPNHVHLIAVPKSEEGLRRAIGEAHKKYSNRINSRENWRGHLWQGRFSSFPMDQNYLIVATRYIEMNPVHARLVKSPEDYIWSSASAHLNGRDDSLVKVEPLLEMVGDWQGFLSGPISGSELLNIKRHERTGRPLGGVRFIQQLELTVDRVLQRRKPGPKSKRTSELSKVSP
jgi:REP-associated tyrosine transposase